MNDFEIIPNIKRKLEAVHSSKRNGMTFFFLTTEDLTPSVENFATLCYRPGKSILSRFLSHWHFCSL